VSLRELEAEFGRDAVDNCHSVLEELMADRLLRVQGDRVALTSRGRLLSNDVFERFLRVDEMAV
jgi:oxygen-independent coproporphyrinogen-3 oxidase